jgi:RNA polymerase sigma factor (TIGR02999 family)
MESHDQTEQAAPDQARLALDALLPEAYQELLVLARRQLAREFVARSVDAATLVHEAYLKLAASVPDIENRSRLLAVAAHAMRQVLVDRARTRHAVKRGGEWDRVTLTDGTATNVFDPEQLLALNDAMERLDPRQRRVVECRFFAGMEETEIATALGVTTRTVQRDWVKARAWLGRWLSESNGA